MAEKQVQLSKVIAIVYNEDSKEVLDEIIGGNREGIEVNYGDYILAEQSGGVYRVNQEQFLELLDRIGTLQLFSGKEYARMKETEKQDEKGQ